MLSREWHTHGAAQNRRENLRAVDHILGTPSFSPYRTKGHYTLHRLR